MRDYFDKSVGKVLFVGDIERAFLDAESASSLNFKVVQSKGDVTGALAAEELSVVAVVMSDSTGRLNATLQSIRQRNKEVKIVLLSQVYEEPLAMRLVDTIIEGKNLADDYLICPISLQGFRRAISPGKEISEIQRSDRSIDLAAEAKIRQLEKLATTDELTGLKNRRYILEFCRQIIEYAGGHKTRVMVLVFDIDDFKHYNDVYGHSAGDEILQQAAVLMERCCRNHDVVGRIGGDEFAVVFWDDPQKPAPKEKVERRLVSVEHPTEPIFIANRFQQELEKTELNLLGPGGKGELTISGGLASFPRDGKTVQELFERADEALLEAKRSGKNRIYLVGMP